MTKIEWTDKTWNPVTGCAKVSAGCDNCYAESIAHRFGGTEAFPNGFDLTLRPDRLAAPLRWRKPRRVFVNSMSDLFHEHIPDEFIAAVWATMFWSSSEGRPDLGYGSRKPRHTYQVLTKRHGRMRSWLRAWGVRDERVAMVRNAADRGWCDADDVDQVALMPAVLPNVWVGVSVEDQRWANVRIPALLDTPAVVHFLSCEPLLGEVDLSGWLRAPAVARPGTWGARRSERIDWVIAGGESGPKARPMHPDWARALRDQCAAVDVPFFYKQAGEWALDVERDAATHLLRGDGQLLARRDATSTVGYGTTAPSEQDLVDRGHYGWARTRRVGKKQAGRALDGRTHDAFPTIGVSR